MEDSEARSALKQARDDGLISLDEYLSLSELRKLPVRLVRKNGNEFP